MAKGPEALRIDLARPRQPSRLALALLASQFT